MLTRAGSNDPDSLGLVPPLLVPMKREPESSNTSVSGSEKRVKLVSREFRDDITDDSSVGDGTSFTYSERDLSKRSRSDTISSEDSETSLLEWDAAMAQLFCADAVILVTPDLLIRALNVSAQHMFGYFPKEVVGQNFQTLIPKHFRRFFSTKIQEIIQNSRPGDMEEIKEGYCERKAGDQFNVIFRVANNLASTTMDPGLVVTVHDESEYLSLQTRAQRRLKELARQVEAKEAMLLKAQAVEERELLQAQALKEVQMKEKKAKKKEFLNEIKEIDVIEMKRRMTEEHEQAQSELIEADMSLKQQIEAAKVANDSEIIHKLELERLRSLFKREALELDLRQRMQSEELKITHMRLANVKAAKQLKESQQMKITALKEAQTLRRFRKEQRSITKSQKLRQISELRETQIEELEALKRKHRQDLFTITNETRKNARKMKYEQEKMAADLLEQQTKLAAEIQITQQKEAQQLKKARDRDAEKIRLEQEAAAKILLRNQEEILQILARRHHDEQTRFSVQLEEKKHYELLAQNCSDMISLHNVDNFACKYVSPSCESLLGYSQEEMQYLNYMDLVHLDNRNEAREAVKRLLEIARGGAKELPSCQQVFRMRRKDGSNVWVERAVKVFWSRTRLKSISGNLALTQGEDDTTLTLTDRVLATTRDDDYHEEMELLFTTRSIPISLSFK